jgi:tetratricopeptide (TPR) repeat protein
VSVSDRGPSLIVSAIALGLCAIDSAAAARQETVRGLRAVPALARVYDAIFDAQFDRVPLELATASGPAPAEACQLLDTVSVWWQIQLDPLNQARDGPFQAKADAAIAATEAWTRREPNRAEAWFYVGGAYGARAQWRVLRGEHLAAARDGKRIKEALERALQLDPEMHDAWFGIGLYRYYADVAPAAAKVLRWLLFLPGGDRVNGLQEMLRARDRGALIRDEADYQLHVIYLWYEQNPRRALELLEALKLRHPTNPIFPQLAADVQDNYLHDVTASLRSYRALLDSARQHKVERAAIAETRARLGIALQLDRLFESDAAIEQLRAVIESRPEAPFGAYAQAQFQLAQALDRMGRRVEAVAAYRAALTSNPAGDPLKIADGARSGLGEVPDPTTASAYRLSIEGWRALEHGNLAEAAEFLEQSLAIRPDDPVTRYRHARLLQAQRNETGALDVLESVVRERATTPPTFYAFACMDAARLHEQRGERTRAIELYRTAQSVFGADQRTKDAAQRALMRLSPPTQGHS